MTLTVRERAELEFELVREWEKLMALRATRPISDKAAARKKETEVRHLRELMRLSLMAARG